MKWEYKEEYFFEKRWVEGEKIWKKYFDRVLVSFVGRFVVIFCEYILFIFDISYLGKGCLY